MLVYVEDKKYRWGRYDIKEIGSMIVKFNVKTINKINSMKTNMNTITEPVK